MEAILRSGLGMLVSSRLKTVGTIIDKLRRERTRLSKMQDIAGARTVVGFRLAEQDEAVQRICERLPNHRVVDRRAEPRFGYRAVHIVASIEDCPVEIQVRTTLQDRWAQFMETVADVFGRGIRYGEPPEQPNERIGSGTAGELVLALMEQSEIFAEIEQILAASYLPSREARVEELLQRNARLLARFAR